MLEISIIQDEINLIPDKQGKQNPKHSKSPKKQDENKIKNYLENLQKEGYSNLIENWIFGKSKTI